MQVLVRLKELLLEVCWDEVGLMKGTFGCDQVEFQARDHLRFDFEIKSAFQLFRFTNVSHLIVLLVCH